MSDTKNQNFVDFFDNDSLMKKENENLNYFDKTTRISEVITRKNDSTFKRFSALRPVTAQEISHKTVSKMVPNLLRATIDKNSNQASREKL